MNNPLNKLHQEASHIRLSQGEKRAMHARIAQAMRPSAAAPRQAQGLYFLFIPQFAMPLAALLLVLVGGGTAFAAKGSLPGEPLYAVKTKVSEPLQGALAFSVEDKIKFHASVAQTRVEEAEILASEDRLDSDATQELEQSIDTHIAARDSLTGELEKQKPGSSVAVLAQIDSSIDAHIDILETLGQGSKDEATRERSGAIAMSVRSSSSRGMAMQSAQPVVAMAVVAPAAAPTAPPKRAALSTMSLKIQTTEASGSAPEATTSGHGTTSARVALAKSAKSKDKGGDDSTKDQGDAKLALLLGQKATTSLEALKVSASKLASSTANTEAQERLSSRFAKVNDLIAQGNNLLASRDYAGAADHFNEALDRMVTLSAFITASQKFDHGILGSLLGNDSHWGWDDGE